MLSTPICFSKRFQATVHGVLSCKMNRKFVRFNGKEKEDNNITKGRITIMLSGDQKRS